MIVPDTMRTAEPGKLRGRIRFRVGQEPEPGFPADLQDEPTEFRSRHQKPADGEG